MPAERPSIPVQVLREALRDRVEETSIREVAAETGMSLTGLWRFLRGTDPYQKTLRRLQDWYIIRMATEPDGDVTVEVALAAIAVLTRHIPPAGRVEAGRRLLETLAAMSRHDPSWLTEIRKRERAR